MNLTPTWSEYFAHNSIASSHWSTLGAFNAKDSEIMAFARENKLVVFTHDLDFGSILAVTHADGPSVIQVRSQDPVPASVGALVISAIRQHYDYLLRGALITIEPDRIRARVLPLHPRSE